MKKLKKAVIIGYGSIGKKHANILKKLKLFNKIYIVTNQKVASNFKKINSLNYLKNIDPDYFLICSETNKHYLQLKYIVNNFKRKIIFVEKPLYEKNYDLKLNNNKVFVGYNFRFHPIVQYIKNFIKNKKVLSVTVLCGSFLPNWRKNILYNKSYSSDKSKGGGVLLDLSHEFDYTKWILGPMIKKYFSYKKISNLKISSNDFLSFIGSSKKAKYILINLDYFSKIPKRQIILEGNNFSLHADLINNYIKVKKFEKNKLIKFSSLSNIKSYIFQHKNILNKKKKIACTYSEAEKLTNFFSKIQK